MLHTHAGPCFAGCIVVCPAANCRPGDASQKKACTEVIEIPAVCDAQKIVLCVISAKNPERATEWVLGERTTVNVMSLRLGTSPGFRKGSDVAKYTKGAFSAALDLLIGNPRISVPQATETTTE